MPQLLLIPLASALAEAGISGGVVTGAAGATVTGVAGGIATGIVGMANLGIMMGISALTAPKPVATGTQVNLSIDPMAPVPIVWGRAGVAGTLGYRESWDEAGSKNNSYLGQIIVLNSGGISGDDTTRGFEYVMLDHYNIALSMDPNDGVAQVTNVSTNGNPNVSPEGLYQKNNYQLRFMRGYDPQVDNIQAWSQHTTATSWPGLDSNARLSGLTFVTAVCYYRKDQYPTGIPPAQLFCIRGQRCYDPRKDSTFTSAAGSGSGSHRLDDPTTWEWTQNPYLMALKWLIGVQENGQKIWGVFVSPSNIDWAAYVNGANVCDANGWTAGGESTSQDNKYDVLTRLLQAGGGVPVDRNGLISCLVSAPQTAVYTVTSDMLVGAVQTVSSIDWKDRVNSINPTYIEETQWWQEYQHDVVSSSNYVTEDGGFLKAKTVQYPFVQNAQQARWLAGLDLANGREFLNITLNLPLTGLNIQAGQCINVNVPEIGANNLKMLVTSRKYDPSSATVQISCRTETDDKYAWAASQTGDAPDALGLTGFDPSNPPAPGAEAWAITDTSIVGPGGEIEPAIVVQGAVDDPVAADVFFYQRVFGGTDADWHFAGGGGSTLEKIVLQNGIAAGVAYEIGVSYLSIYSVESPKLVIGPATAGSSISSGVVPGGIDWFGNTIANIPGGLDTNNLGQLYANNISYGGMTVNAALNQYGLDLANVILETNALSLSGDIANAQADIDNVAIATMQNDVRFYNLNDLVNQLNYVNGASVATIVTNNIVQQANTNSAFVEKFDLIGTIFPDGSGFQMSNSTLYWDNSTLVANKITGIEANVANNTALIFSQANSFASNIATLTLTFDSQLAQTGNNIANAVHFTQTVSDLANATAIEASQLQSAVLGANATITSEASTRASNDNALSSRIDSVYAASNSVSAAVSAETTARVNGNSALASQVSSISTTVSGHTTTITSQQTSINGLEGKAGLTISSGNVITGWSLNNNGSSGSFIVMASQLALVDNSGGSYTVPFNVVGGTTYMTSVVAGNIQAGSIYAAQINPGVVNTDHLEAGAVTNGQGFVYSGSTTFGTSPVTLLNYDRTSDVGGAEFITASFTFTLPSGSIWGADLTLYIDGGQTAQWRFAVPVTGVNTTFSAIKMVFGLTAGSHNYQWVATSEHSGTTFTANELDVAHIEFKR